MTKKEFSDAIENVIAIGTEEKERINYMLGIKIHDCDFDKKTIEFSFDVEEWQLNPYGGVHGGIICSIFDTCMGMGTVAITQRKSATTDISVSYLRPLMDKQYIVHVEYTHVGRTMVRCMGKMYEAESHKVCATAMSSFAVSSEGFGKPQV